MQQVRTPILIRLGNRRGQGTLRNVNLSNLCIGSDEGGEEEWAGREIPDEPASYPEARMFGRLPASGLYVRHVKSITLNNYEIESTKPNYRPLLVCDDVQKVEVSGLRANASQGRQSVVRLKKVRNAFFRGCSAPTGSGTFLEADGATQDVTILGCDLGAAKNIVAGGGAREVFEAGNRPPKATG